MGSRQRLHSSPLLVLLLSGCATVDPREDYEQAEEYIRAATGASEAYQPGNEEGLAQQVQQLLSEGLTAAKAAQITLIHNPSLQAAFFSIGIARADLVQAGLFSNLSLGVSLRFPSGGGLVNVETSLAQNIVELWQIPARERAAERDLHRVVLEIARMAAELALEAKRAYYNSVSADEAVSVATQNAATALEFLELVLARQQAGAGNEIDVNVARSAYLEEELAVKHARLLAFESRNRLTIFLGLSLDPEKLVLVEPLSPPPSSLPEPGKLREIAGQHRLDLRAAEQVVQAAAARLELEERSVLRQLVPGLSAERDARKAGGDGDFVIGPTLEVELPLFDQNQAQIARATFACDEARKLLLALDRLLTQEVRGAWKRAQAAWEVDHFYRDELLPPRRDNLELAREAYRLGRTSFLSVLEAQQTLLATRQEYNVARRASAGAVVDLERVVGRPIDKILIPDEVGSPAEAETGGEEEDGS